jgi:hypothetical protein
MAHCEAVKKERHDTNENSIAKQLKKREGQRGISLGADPRARVFTSSLVTVLTGLSG